MQDKRLVLYIYFTLFVITFYYIKVRRRHLKIKLKILLCTFTHQKRFFFILF